MIATIAGTRRVQVARERRHFTAEQKLSILRKHLLEGAAIADVCDQQGLTPGPPVEGSQRQEALRSFGRRHNMIVSIAWLGSETRVYR